MQITVMGADRRQFYLAGFLQEAGHTVETYGVSGLSDSRKSLAALLADTEALILPTPVCNSEGKIVLTDQRFPAADTIVSLLSEQALVFGGRLPIAFRARFSCFDPLEDEAVAIANAVPTAEGAIALAMQELPRTICGSKCLVIGYGRIGKVLARRLTGLGAQVTVAARKSGDLASAAAFGYQTTVTALYSQGLDSYQCIFNTVPAMVLPEDQLRRTAPDCLLIDLASKPGGIDFSACQSLSRKVIHALSLPGKVAPATAGQILSQFVLNHLSRKE